MECFPVSMDFEHSKVYESFESPRPFLPPVPKFGLPPIPRFLTSQMSPYNREIEYTTGERIIYKESIYSFKPAGPSSSPPPDESTGGQNWVRISPPSPYDHTVKYTANDRVIFNGSIYSASKIGGWTFGYTPDQGEREGRVWVKIGPVPPPGSSNPAPGSSNPAPGSSNPPPVSTEIINGLDNSMLFIIIGIIVFIIIIIIVIVALKSSPGAIVTNDSLYI
jgi:hypothetical protein